MLKLFVGDITQELSDFANSNAYSVLVTKNNYKKIIEQSKTQDIVGHTSFGDLDKITMTESPFYNLLLAADTIEYYPPLRWSDHSDVYKLHSMQRITEYYLYDIQRQKNNVIGLNLDHWTKNIKYLKLADSRKTDYQNLWITGGSADHGVGVELNQRYGQLLSDELNLPVNWLTDGGTSIEWQADQILRSDIRPNDVIVWGLTSEYRAVEWDKDKNKIRHINSYDFDASEVGSLAIVSEENRLYKALIAINQVENFCIKLGVKLIMWPMLASETLRLYLSSNKCYVEYPYQINFVDIGTDGSHPGPKQHRVWANYLKYYISNVENNEKNFG